MEKSEGAFWTTSVYNGICFSIEKYENATNPGHTFKYEDTNVNAGNPRYVKPDGSGRLINNVKVSGTGNLHTYKFTLLQVDFKDSRMSGENDTLISIPEDSKVRFNQDMINYQHIVSGPSQFTLDDGVL